MKRIRLPAFVLLLLMVSGCAAQARLRSTAPGESPARSSQQRGSPDQAVAQTPRFSLYSDPWISLHHFLYQWAVAAKREGGAKTSVPVVEVPERGELPQLAAAERQTWTDAVDYYQREVISRSLLFDAGLIAVNEQLTQAAATRRASLAGLPPRWREVLEGAMQVYEQHWWPRHDARNRTWIQRLAPKLHSYEATLTTGVARAFGATLPAQAVRIDVAAYSEWTGAYTTGNPGHIVIASGNPALQDFGALEIVIHEFCHRDELELPVHDLVARAFAKSHATPPLDLWHALIFYTACELTREVLHADGTEDYQCVADRVGLLRRNPRWQPYWRSLDAHWKPFLAGQGADRDSAAAEVARDLVPSPGRSETSADGRAEALAL